MNVGYVYPFEANPPQGGNRLHAYQLIRGFLARGHEVLTFGDASMDDVQCFPRTPQGVRAIRDAIDILYVRIDANHLRRAPLVVELLNSSTAPLVWEINAPANENLAFSWLGGHRPQETFLQRGFDRLRRTLHAARQQPSIIREEAFRRKLARRVDAAICVSKAVGRYAQEHLGLAIVRVLPNGSDPKLNHPGLAPASLPERYQDRLAVLFAGSPIYPWQGMDLLLDTAAAEDDWLAYLLLVNQPLSRRTPDNVLVLESVPYADIGSYICAADVCLALQPDFGWSPWGFHGSPMKIFDYMACGKPIVTTGVGQLGDVIREHDNGLICDPTPDDVRRKLHYLRSHPDEVRRMGANSRQAVIERYNWNHIVEETLALLSHTLEHREPHPHG